MRFFVLLFTAFEVNVAVKVAFVALFFAFADPDFPYEAPNPSRAIFVKPVN